MSNIDVPATNYTFFTVSTTQTQPVNNGEPIWVHGIHIAAVVAGTNAIFHFIDNDNANVISLYASSQAANEPSNTSMKVPFLARNGLVVPTSTQAYKVTVFWRPTG